MPNTILEDTRAIRYVCFADSESCIATDDQHISKIVAYPEPGQNAYVTYYAIYDEHNELFMRINGAYISVIEYE